MVDTFSDAEGGDGHGRNNNLNTVQVKIVSLGRSWLTDIKTLGDKAFETSCATGLKLSFRQVLKSPEIPVVWFDVRADSDSLFGHHGVHLKGVIDLQIMEMITRSGSRRRRNGLDSYNRSLPGDKLPPALFVAWNEIGAAGKNVCSEPEKYAAFDCRPLPLELEQYAINDVEFMPLLFCYYSEERELCKSEGLMKMVLELSERAVTETIQPDYAGNSYSHRRGIPELIDMWETYNFDYY
jgi:exonuclease 3'-5' domain-containing protein 1